MATTHEEQKAMQRAAMEKARFGATREQVLATKGAKCAHCGSTKDLTIDHINGGGRHNTERGMIVPDKTHNMDNLQVLCSHCSGLKDRARGMMGMGTAGNPNNPSQ